MSAKGGDDDMSDRSAGPTRLDVDAVSTDVVPDFPDPTSGRLPAGRTSSIHSARVYRLAYPPHPGPARGRGSHPGGLCPGLPLAVQLHPRHIRGLAASHHHQPLPRHGAPQAAHPLRCSGGARPSASPAADRRRPRSTTTPISTVTWRPPSRPCRPTSAPWCCVTSRACRTRRSPATLGVKLGTVRSRIHRGRAALRAALDHRAPKPAGRRLSAVAPAAAAS